MNLSQRPPRSPRVRLGGYVHLPRLLDKARAAAAGTLGEYIYPCPLDRLFFEFTGVTSEQILDLVKAGKGDGDVLAWVRAHAPIRRADWEIAAWSAWMESRAPSGVEGFTRMADMLKTVAPHRDDVRTGFDRLDLDDHVSFGGKP